MNEIDKLTRRLSKIAKRFEVAKTEKEKRLLVAEGFEMIAKSIEHSLSKFLN